MKITMCFDTHEEGDIEEIRKVLQVIVGTSAASLSSAHVDARQAPATSLPAAPPPPPGEQVPPFPPVHAAPPAPPAAPPPPANGPVFAAPPPPVIAPAPPPPTPPAPSPAEAAALAPRVLDSAGYPWDKRFHADSKNKTKNGQWRRKKKFDEAEYLAAYPAPFSGGAAPILFTVVPPLAPVPPGITAPPADGLRVDWNMVGAAITERAGKYSMENIQNVLKSALIDPSTLCETPALHAHALHVLETQCPM